MWLAVVLMAGSLAWSTSFADPQGPESGPSPALSWSISLESDVEWMLPTPSAVLVVATKTGLAGLDMTHGEILWRIPDLVPPDRVRVEVLPRPPLVLLRMSKGVRGMIVRIIMDVTTGRELWNSADIGLADVERQQYSPLTEALLLAGTPIHGEADGVVMAANIETGQIQWSLPLPQKEAEAIVGGSMRFGVDSTLFVLVGNRVRSYDLRNGSHRWTSETLKPGKKKRCAEPRAPTGEERVDPRTLPATATPVLSRDGQTVFVARELSLYALNAFDGRLLWKKPPRLCGRIVQVIECSEGLLARAMPLTRGSDELVLLDRDNGKARWTAPKAKKKSFWDYLADGPNPHEPKLLDSHVWLSNPIVDQEHAYVVNRSQLQRILLANGSSVDLGALRSRDKRVIRRIERYGDTLLVSGEQDYEWLDIEGRRIEFKQFERADGVDEGLRMLTGALVLNVLPTISLGPVTVDPQGDYGPAFEQMMQTYSASRNAESFGFVLTKRYEPEVHPALVALDKRRANVLGHFPIAIEPYYEVDVMNRRIFILNKKRTVSSHGF